MTTCRTCGETAYGGLELCPLCTGGAAVGDERLALDLFDDDSQASTLDLTADAVESDADADDLLALIPERTTSELELDVHIEPRFEWGSAPREGDPEMSVLLTLTPTGRPLMEEREGPVAHVILALDLSNSMNRPDKYPLLTRALERMLNDLKAPGSREVLLSVVVFAWGSEVLFRAVPASVLSTRDVLQALDRSEMRFGRYTDMAGALSRAGRIAYESHRRDKSLPLRIYLLTDGKPQDNARARRVMEKMARIPVDVDAFAFGADADVEMIQELVCGNRGGTVKHLRSETIGEAYARVAEVAQLVVAKRAILEIQLSTGVVGGAVYRFRPGRHAFGKDAFAGGRVFRTDLGTLETGRSYSVLFQVRLPLTTTGVTEVGHVSLLVPGRGGPREIRSALVIPRHRGAMLVDRDPVVVEARDVLDAIEDHDPEAMLKALRARRKMYISEHRDPYLIDIVDKAISELETVGTLEALSHDERAALIAHTATAGSDR